MIVRTLQLEDVFVSVIDPRFDLLCHHTSTNHQSLCPGIPGIVEMTKVVRTVRDAVLAGWRSQVFIMPAPVLVVPLAVSATAAFLYDPHSVNGARYNGGQCPRCDYAFW